MRTFSTIEKLISTLDVNSVTIERKAVLQPLVNFIQEKHKQKKLTNLNFICTHNSRRSHFAQVWAQTMAAYFGLNNVVCYSGGTEATALFPVVAKTLQDSGFKVNAISQGSNPIYAIKYEDNSNPIIGFSKTFDNGFNPVSNFAAILTCSQADSGCPFIAGAEKRISVTYEDPKVFDNTPQQEEKYNERSLQIATEMFYVFSQIK